MHWSGIDNEQSLQAHITRVSYPNEWGTNTELNMVAALARIDVVAIDATDVDQNKLCIRLVYSHEQLDPPFEYDPIYEGRVVGDNYISQARPSSWNLSL